VVCRSNSSSLSPKLPLSSDSYSFSEALWYAEVCGESEPDVDSWSRRRVRVELMLAKAWARDVLGVATSVEVEGGTMVV
jgi:hypothetical protein